MLPARNIILSLVYDHSNVIVTVYSDTFGFEQTFLIDTHDDAVCRESIKKIEVYVNSLLESLGSTSTARCVCEYLKRKLEFVDVFADEIDRGKSREILIAI